MIGAQMSRPFPLRFLSRKLADFARDERGTLLAEFVIVFPLLIWAFLGIFLFWDVYRAINLAQKASFTLADNLSRADKDVTTANIDGLAKLLAYLSEADAADGETVRLRVSSLKWNKTSSTHEVAWSYAANTGTTKSMPKLTTGGIPAIKDQLPTLTEFETVLLIETEVDFVPAFTGGNVGGYTMGVGSRTFTEFVVIRPRFIPKVCLQGTACT
jgi:Flp pilus assembly protein TadG